MTVVVKLGGSVLTRGRELVQFLSRYAQANGISIVIIPGGGPFAEAVKKLAERVSISDDAAHWMAVLAMHQYGLFLADGEPEIPVVERIAEIQHADHICIVLPYKILEADDFLPHTWAVTADTIAAFITHKLGEKTFIKVTDVDGISDETGSLIKKIQPNELIEKDHRGCIDMELPRFLLQHDLRCVIVNGNYPERIIDVIEGRETISTKIPL
jgi:aspartokinase-like uncharacterized kinase